MCNKKWLEKFSEEIIHGSSLSAKVSDEKGNAIFVNNSIIKIKDEKKNSEYKMRILVIDDEEVVREILKRMIQLFSKNYKVDVASNGQEGIEMMRQQEYDIVITDLAMPQINGWEVARYVRDNYPHIAVVLMTGYNISMNNETVKEAGIKFILNKPFSAAMAKDTLNLLKRDITYN